MFRCKLHNCNTMNGSTPYTNFLQERRRMHSDSMFAAPFSTTKSTPGTAKQNVIGKVSAPPPNGGGVRTNATVLCNGVHAKRHKK